MSLIPNDEDRARQAGFAQGAAMAEAENARLRADNDRLRGLLRECREREYMNAYLRERIDAALAGAADQPAAARCFKCGHEEHGEPCVNVAPDNSPDAT